MADDQKYNATMRYAGLATQWMVMLLAATWTGIKLDNWTGWRFPLFLVLLPLLALCTSMWMLIKELNKPKK